MIGPDPSPKLGPALLWSASLSVLLWLAIFGLLT